MIINYEGHGLIWKLTDEYVLLNSCGLKTNDPRHTLGGRQSNDPWVVSLGFHDDDDYHHQCTGSILTKKAVLSAAHCFIDPG